MAGRNSGADLWNQAKKLIPGGNQLLSKRAEMFLPDYWPAYYKKAKGVEVWDLDDNKYVDMSIMGIGSCVLGYAHDGVDRAVKNAIDQGNMSSLNSFEEVELAKKLVQLHPWAKMVRFARTGGEANAVAIRIARAYAKKDKIAFCGYHGWSDWYLAANLADAKNLDGQLLPGLAPAGVPRVLKGTAIPFRYGHLEELQGIIAKNKGEVGVIIMEVARNKKIDLTFIRGVRRIANEIGAVLIFDEISSGFRTCTGGMHLLYGLEPDIAVFGKALGNGYPITAIVGREKIMAAAQDSLISSTFWTERLGFVAALETIRQFEEHQVAKHLVAIGEYVAAGLKKIIVANDLNIEIVGFSAVPTMKIKEDNALIIKTIFTQEMLKRGYLALTVIYLSYAHTKEVIDLYLKEADEVLGLIAKALQTGRLEQILKGPVCHSGFQRLN